MQLKNLRTTLQPTITELTKAADYWSEQYVRGRASYQEYSRITMILQDIKDFIVTNERNGDEELRLSSGSNGGLHEDMDEGMANSGVEYFGAARDRYARSNS